MILIGLSGPKGSGKTTAAHLLVEEFGFRRMSFADPIREAVLELFPEWTAEHFAPGRKDQEDALHNVSPRHAMRVIGEHARRLDPLIYVDALNTRVREAATQDPGVRIVVDDVRLIDEANMIRMRGRVVHVERAGVGWSGEHVTEVGIEREDDDLRLQNVAGVRVLRSNVRALMSVIAPTAGQAPARRRG